MGVLRGGGFIPPHASSATARAFPSSTLGVGSLHHVRSLSPASRKFRVADRQEEGSFSVFITRLCQSSSHSVVVVVRVPDEEGVGLSSPLGTFFLLFVFGTQIYREALPCLFHPFVKGSSSSVVVVCGVLHQGLWGLKPTETPLFFFPSF